MSGMARASGFGRDEQIFALLGFSSGSAETIHETKESDSSESSLSAEGPFDNMQPGMQNLDPNST